MTLLPITIDRKYFTSYLYGSLMTLISMGIYFSMDSIVHMAVKSQMTLDPSGEFFRHWLEVPIPITFKYYLFHIDNPEDILNGGKPRVSERGSMQFEKITEVKNYKSEFRMWRYKEILKWADDRSTVKYFEYNKFEFDGENTNSILSPFVYRMLNLFLSVHRQHLFTIQTVNEVIHGKRVEMFNTITTLMKPLDWLGIKNLPKNAMPPNNTVGLLVGRNNIPEGPIEVYTGITDVGIATQISSWKNEKTLKLWKTSPCNMINGSDGSLFKPGLKFGDSLYTFTGDLCRSTKLVFDRESEHMGIPTYRYVDDPTLLMGTKSAPENECFCLHKDKMKCEIDGLLDLSHCQFGAPLLITKPHFLSFPHLQNKVDGLQPNENDHISYMEIQPTLGTPLYCIKRMMFVIRVENNPRISAYRNIRNNFIPFFWIEVEGGLNETFANQIMYSFVYPLQATIVATTALGITGIAMLFTTFARQWFKMETKVQ
ncbi:CD36-like protein 5 [Leptotrombidium deliense]|uniref:CD36-like protein 5 n=1 Tax=Leptotrombidium deliense TaxID=299467 RepID=A0A443S379_9ACAR|nr:CD36-like protein 5 [Leptotrombidium deliense]